MSSLLRQKKSMSEIEATLINLLDSLVLVLQELSFEFGGTHPLPGEIELKRAVSYLKTYQEEVQKDTLLN